jgi:hypothetical protein
MSSTYTQLAVTRIMRLLGAYWLPVPVDQPAPRRRPVGVR